MNDWRIARIDDFFDIQQGKQVSKKNREGNNQRPFLRTANVFWSKIDTSKLDYMHFSPEEEKKFALQEGDLLVCEGGDVGRTAIWHSEIKRCYYQNHLHRLRSKNKNIDESFFQLWLLYAFTNNIYFGRANITTIPNLSKSRLSELEFPVPILKEQKNISYILSSIQKAIEANEKIIQTTIELKKSLMQKLFTEGLYGEKQKQTEIGLMPESWNISELKEITNKIQYGYTASAKNSGKIKFLRITDITDHGVEWVHVPYCALPNNIENYLLEDNDIVFARIGATTGKSYLISSPPLAVFASYLIRVQANEKIDPYYLYYFFQSSQYWKQINFNKGATVKGGVNGSILAKLNVPVTNIAEQKTIGQSLLTIDNKIAFTLKRKANLKHLFNSLLHQLMSGEIRIDKIDL